MDDKSTSIIPRDEVHILVTEEDKTGEDRNGIMSGLHKLDPLGQPLRHLV